MQQEELKKQQQSQLMLLKSQHIKMVDSNVNLETPKDTCLENEEVLAYPLVNSGGEDDEDDDV